MLVPRTRLLLWTGLVAPPFALLAAVEPAATLLALCAILALFTLVVTDAAASRAGLAGISLQLPPFCRFSRNRPGRIELRVRNEQQTAKVLRLALPLPREIHSPTEEAELHLPAGSEWSRLAWSCRPLRRGRYRLERAHLETASRLGFWNVRRNIPAPTELRVYPDLFTERKELAALFLNRGTFGLHTLRQVGKGREFEKLREYIPGDSFEDIHWKATARRGRPITKVFQIERTQEVYVVIDSSRLSSRLVEGNSKSEIRNPKSEPGQTRLELQPGGTRSSGSVIDAAGTTGLAGEGPCQTQEATTLERFITASLLLGLAAERQGDLFGVVTFNDRVENFVRARSGQAHFNSCREALYNLEPKVVSPDYDEVFTFLRLRLQRRALLIFLTELDDPVLAESFVQKLDLVRRQHLVLVNMIQPQGVAPLFSEPNAESTDDLYDRLAGHLRWHSLKEFGKVLQRRGVPFALLRNERLSAELVSQYLNVKRRQIL